MRIDRGDRRLQSDGDLAFLLGVRAGGEDAKQGSPPPAGACAAWVSLLCVAAGDDTVRRWIPSQRFEALLAAGKDSALLRFSLGMQYLKAGESVRAAEHLRAAVAHDPGYSAAWKLLGGRSRRRPTVEAAAA